MLHFSAGSGGGGGSGGESQSNSSTAQAIGKKVVDLISGASNNTQVTVTVSPDGAVSVNVDKGNANGAAILNGLKDAGLVSSNGTVDFDSNDTIYANAYKIKIIKNNGNGGTIHVSPIDN